MGVLFLCDCRDNYKKGEKMFRLTTEKSFDAAHFLKDYKGRIWIIDDDSDDELADLTIVNDDELEE